MANRVSASIEIGGTVSSEDFAALAGIIANEALSLEWDGEPFEADQHVEGQPLRLFAHEVAWGRFDPLEARCRELGLAFVRWSGGYDRQWGPCRVAFTGKGDTNVYPVDEDDVAVITRERLEAFGTIEAAMAWFDAADFAVPPLVVTTGGPADGLAASAPEAA